METHPINSPEIAAVFDSFPQTIRERLLEIRSLILRIGNRVDPIAKASEAIKWGEPSYTTISGSPIRLGWKRNAPERFAIYFHCQTKLISTFRILYPETFSFEGNRAIVFEKADPIPEKELSRCIELAFTYHKRKNEPLLGEKP